MCSHLRTALAIAALSAVACIERAPSPRDRRDRFDRGGLSEVLLRELPSPATKVGAVFGDSVELVGTDVSPAQPKPGDSVQVTFYFRVTDESDDDYKVFVHIDDRSGRAERINADHWPARGKYPTSAWRRGEVVRDEWTFTVPSYYSGEGLDLWTGFYQPGKDERWPLANGKDVRHDGQNRVVAATVATR
jgi:hypothetical protein